MNIIFRVMFVIFILLIYIKAQKIDNYILKIYIIVIRRFSIDNKLSKIRFFKNIFLIVNNKIDIVLQMFFLTFSNASILFNI